MKGNLEEVLIVTTQNVVTLQIVESSQVDLNDDNQKTNGESHSF
jgi:hypothetical protein